MPEPHIFFIPLQKRLHKPCRMIILTYLRLNFSFQILASFGNNPYICTRNEINEDMTAIDLRASTMQILERFDKTDASLWQKVLDAINSIYKSEEEAQSAKKVQQKAKIRQMVGILSEESTSDWKREKEEYLTEKYQ